MSLLCLLTVGMRVQSVSGQKADRWLSDELFVPGLVVVQFAEAPPSPAVAKTGIRAFDEALEKFVPVEFVPTLPFLPRAHQKRSAAWSRLQRTYYVRYEAAVSPSIVASILSRVEGVSYAEPKYAQRRLTTRTPKATKAIPSDPLFSDQAVYLGLLSVPEAWDFAKGEDGSVVIAVIGGVADLAHPDIHPNLWTNSGEIPSNGADDDGNGFIDDVHGWNFALDRGEPSGKAPDWHETVVAGAAAGVTDNGQGIAGTSWNARVMVVDVECPTQPSLRCFAEDGIAYAANSGAAVINASYGRFGRSSQYEQDIYALATELGSLVVAAAGNENWSVDRLPKWPAGYPRVLSVGASRSYDDFKADFSNYGVSVDVFAPGEGIVSTVPGSSYDQGLWGTSFSTPLVSGIAALVRTRFPDDSPDQLRERIRVTADNIDRKNPAYVGKLGRGRVNALRALTDTDLRSVRVSGYEIVSAGDEAGVQRGDTVVARMRLTNYLSAVENLSISFSAEDPSVEILSPPEAVGPLLGGATSNTTLRFVVDEESPDFRYLPLVAELSGTDYSDRDLVRLWLEENGVATHTSGPALSVSVTDEGNIGFVGPAGSPGDGFVYRGRHVLYEGGLMLATGADRVSDCVRGVTGFNQDFRVARGSKIAITAPGRATSEEGRVELVESTYTPIGVSIFQTSYVDSSPANDDFLILRYSITNITDATIDNLHAGLYLDWDVRSDAVDAASFDADRGVGVVTDGQGHFVGTRLLTTHQELVYSAMRNEVTYEGDPHYGFSDGEKWSLLSGGVVPNPVSGTDVAQVIGSGPLMLESGETAQVAFALVGGNSRDDLLLNADAAQSLWDGVLSPLPVAIDPEVPPLDAGIAIGPVYPNPTFADAVVEVSLDRPGFVRLATYDVLGRRVSHRNLGQYEAGSHRLTWSGSDSVGRPLPAGMYFIRVEVVPASGRRVISSKPVVLLR